MTKFVRTTKEIKQTGDKKKDEALSQLGKTLKKAELEAVRGVYRLKAKPPSAGTLALYEPAANTRAFAMKSGARLLVNMARGFFENANISLHRNFGYPFVPGSAVKGCTAHCARETWRGAETDDQKLEIARRIVRVFGFPTNDAKLDADLRKNVPEKELPDSAGKIVFMAAIPDGRVPELCVDVLTPHHSEYYKKSANDEEAKATDDEDPVPSFFLAVEKGATFRFALRGVNGCEPADLDFAEKTLKTALTLNGIGAKTAAGYGWFEENDKISKMLSRAEALAASGDSALVAKILAMKNSELGDFLKKETLSGEEKNAFKTALPELTNGQKNKLKELWKKGKGAAWRNLSAIFGDEAENQFT